MENLPLEEVVKQSFGRNPGLFNNAGQHYNHIHFWKWMKNGGGGNRLPGALQKAVDADLGGYDKFKADFVAAGTTQFGSGWAWLSVKDGKLAHLQDAERREPAGSRRPADPRRRCLGAFLLHRLPQRPAEISRSVRRQPDQLGLRAGTLRERPIVRQFASVRGEKGVRSGDALSSQLGARASRNREAGRRNFLR